MLVSVETSLPCPAEEAWAILLAWERQADWMLDADRVEVIGERREGVGVRLAVRTRILGLPAFTEPMEVVAWDPPRRLTLRHGSIAASTHSPGPIGGASPYAGAIVGDGAHLHTHLLALLAHPNIASKADVIRIYDHEVQGGTVVKPLTGAMNDGPSDGV